MRDNINFRLNISNQNIAESIWNSYMQCFDHERLKILFLFFQTLVAASVDARQQKGGKNVVNIHITMNYKVC